MYNLTALSLGFGVQSWTIAVLSVTGRISPIQHAIFSNTGFESEATLQFAREQSDWLRNKGMQVHWTSPKWSSVGDVNLIPAFTPGGGQLTRSCTNHWKIRPVRAQLRLLLGSEAVFGKKISLAIGISTNETGRAKQSKLKWIDNVFPLLELRMNRAACIYWLKQNKLPVPPRSSCIICPYRDWQRQPLSERDKARAIRVDNELGFDRYLHRSCRPLKDIDLRSEEERGQLRLL